MWDGGSKLDLNPHTGGWPAFSFYVGLGIQTTYKVYYSMSHPGSTVADFVSHVASGSNHMFLYGRLLGVLVPAAAASFHLEPGSEEHTKAGAGMIDEAAEFYGNAQRIILQKT